MEEEPGIASGVGRVSISGGMTDVTAPAMVEVQVSSDGKVLWINVDGRCLFRACRIGRITINGKKVAPR